MKKVKMAVVRTILTEELYEVTVTDSRAKEIQALNNKNDEIAEMVDDDYQRARRSLSPAKFAERTVNDKVTFLKLKFVDVK